MVEAELRVAGDRLTILLWKSGNVVSYFVGQSVSQSVKSALLMHHEEVGKNLGRRGRE